ncbi:MAG: hypothetical protein HC853_00070 [Anaerolineae bacterium]|nr:hypothetical protein [Anaerolineae bacterium]
MGSVGIYLLLGFLANFVADLVLRWRYGPLSKLDSRTKRFKRIGRWIAVVLVMLGLALTNVSLRYAIPIALLSVTAATDFELRRLPWDWFMYGSVVVGLLVAYLFGGTEDLSQAIIAQAVLYAFITFAVVVIGQTRGGDIKVAMQYGAACANLGMALNGMLLASVIVMVPIAIVSLIATRRFA